MTTLAGKVVSPLGRVGGGGGGANVLSWRRFELANDQRSNAIRSSQSCHFVVRTRSSSSLSKIFEHGETICHHDDAKFAALSEANGGQNGGQTAAS